MSPSAFWECTIVEVQAAIYGYYEQENERTQAAAKIMRLQSSIIVSMFSKGIVSPQELFVLPGEEVSGPERLSKEQELLIFEDYERLADYYKETGEVAKLSLLQAKDFEKLTIQINGKG